MTAKQFNKEKENLYKRHNAVKTDLSHEVMIETKFGIMYISSEWIPRIKVGNIHSRLEGQMTSFRDVTGYSMNVYNGKLNFYFDNALNTLEELDEYLDNLNTLN